MQCKLASAMLAAVSWLNLCRGLRRMTGAVLLVWKTWLMRGLKGRLRLRGSARRAHVLPPLPEDALLVVASHLNAAELSAVCATSRAHEMACLGAWPALLLKLVGELGAGGAVAQLSRGDCASREYREARLLFRELAPTCAAARVAERHAAVPGSCWVAIHNVAYDLSRYPRRTQQKMVFSERKNPAQRRHSRAKKRTSRVDFSETHTS